MRLARPLAAASSIFALSLGCSAAPDPDEAVASSDDALRAPCDLATSCADNLKIVSAVGTTLQRKNLREELTVDWQGDAEYPLELISGGTSRLLRYDGSRAVKLAGSADGTRSLAVDDCLVVEVLDASGARIASGTINAMSSLLLDGAAVPSLAAGATWNGSAQGWSYPSVDISALLPRDRPFRLRVGAYDITGWAMTSDVFVHVDAASTPPTPPPPPPAALDPFDAASCNGPKLTMNQAKGYFPPASSRVTFPITTTFFARERRCNPVTGCAAWESKSATQFEMSPQGSQIGVPAGQEGSVVLFVGNVGGIYGSLRGTKYARPGYPGYVNTLGAVFNVVAGGAATLLTTPGDVATTGGSPVDGSITRALVNPSCVQIWASLHTGDPTVQRQVAWFGHL